MAQKNVNWPLLALLAAILAGYTFFQQYWQAGGPSPARQRQAAGDTLLARAFAEKLSDLQVEGHGLVAKILPDESKGSRHQRFIVKLDSGQTLMVAHNIDLAPRIDALAVGDEIIFAGEYQWNAQGGVIHWTHHDPDGRHPAGWLKHGGITFQ